MKRRKKCDIQHLNEEGTIVDHPSINYSIFLQIANRSSSSTTIVHSFASTLFFLFKLNSKLQLHESTAHPMTTMMLPLRNPFIYLFLHHQPNTRKVIWCKFRWDFYLEDVRRRHPFLQHLNIIVINFNYGSPRTQEIQHKQSQLPLNRLGFISGLFHTRWLDKTLKLCIKKLPTGQRDLLLESWNKGISSSLVGLLSTHFLPTILFIAKQKNNVHWIISRKAHIKNFLCFEWFFFFLLFFVSRWTSEKKIIYKMWNIKINEIQWRTPFIPC